MAEPVRLVIWDLDETFWLGTLTEGGIKEYVQNNHDIVIELANRGIMSSVCSKNDWGTVQPILQEKGILDYIVFPSVSWEPKGIRIAGIIEAMGLRPATVLFIDDNPNNLAEAKSIIPNLQVSDESIIPSILSNSLFKGKDDKALSRLQQYKLLEQKKRDESQAADNANEFLKSCDIRVVVDYDIEGNVDRVVELINRTNQLNYTKKRLPEDIVEARRIILNEVGHYQRQAGLIRVVDKYGDYGFVGFFLKQTTITDSWLLHYCWSCRTLGMFVEAWFYDYLGRPRLKVEGEVLTNLSEPRDIDWIRLSDDSEEGADRDQKSIPEVRMVGGCEVNAIGHYLSSKTPKIVMEANFPAAGMYVRVQGSALLLSSVERNTSEFRAEAEAMGLPADLLISDYFAPAPHGTLFTFSAVLDSGYIAYRHKQGGWLIRVEPEGLFHDLTEITDAQIDDYLNTKSFWSQASLKAGGPERIRQCIRHIRENYISVRGPSEDVLRRDMMDIFSRIPIGGKLIILVPDDVVRPNKVLEVSPGVTRYIERITRIAEGIPFVNLVYIKDAIEKESDIHEGRNHYDRMVYFRLANKIIDIYDSIPGKTENDLG